MKLSNSRAVVMLAALCCAIVSAPAVAAQAPSQPAMKSTAQTTAQSATLIGNVLVDDKAETPLRNAEVLIPSLKLSTRSDSTGKFSLTLVPAGRHQVLVRILGYASSMVELQFDPAKTVDLDFLLKPNVTNLKSVDVKGISTTGPWAIKLAEFDERRRVGVGRFLTADYFDAKDGRPLSSFVMEKIPGIKVVQSGGRHWLASTRGCGAGKCPMSGLTLDRVPPACYVQVVVNGIVRYNDGGLMFDLDELNSKDIIGLEYYTVATTPLQYNKTSANTKCGTVVIWTKGG